MSLLKAHDIAKMTREEVNMRLTELKLELVKAHVAARKQAANTKELKRVIARCMTRLQAMQQEAQQKR